MHTAPFFIMVFIETITIKILYMFKEKRSMNLKKSQAVT